MRHGQTLTLLLSLLVLSPNARAQNQLEIAHVVSVTRGGIKLGQVNEVKLEVRVGNVGSSPVRTYHLETEVLGRVIRHTRPAGRALHPLHAERIEMTFILDLSGPDAADVPTRIEPEMTLLSPNGRRVLHREPYVLSLEPAHILAPALLLSPGLFFLPVTEVEAMPVWRIQLTTLTCDRDGAESGDLVTARFAPQARSSIQIGGSHSSGGRTTTGSGTASSPTPEFVLNPPGGGRGRGARTTYEVILPSIRRMSDIQQLEFIIDGSDDWCLEEVQLHVNSTGSWDPGIAVFTKRFPRGLWLRRDRASNASAVVASSEELRAAPTWNLNGARAALAAPPTRYPGAVLESMFQGIVGHELSPRRGILRDYKWGRRRGNEYVSLETDYQRAPNVARIRADLNEADSRQRRRNDIDLVVTVVATCPDGQLQLDIAHATATGRPDWLQVFNPIRHLGASLLLALDPRTGFDPVSGTWRAGQQITPNAERRQVNTSGGATVGGAPCDRDAVRFESDGTLVLRSS